jgi:hypothetical protein
LCCIASNAGANGFPDITPDFSECSEGALGSRFVCDGLVSALTDHGAQALYVPEGPALCGYDGDSPCTGALTLSFSPPMSSVTFTVNGAPNNAITAFDDSNQVIDSDVGNGTITLSGGPITRVEFSSASDWSINGLIYHPTVQVWGCTDDCTGTALPADTDNDGTFDPDDTDDDNDGVLDGDDRDPLDPHRCQDSDHDTCDDCSTGVDGSGEGSDVAPFDDGPDADSDGICDAGDDQWLLESSTFTVDPESDDDCWWSGGGVRFDSGRDLNGDGLDPSEIESSVSVCYAYDGDNKITYSEAIEPGGDSPCPTGGVFLQYVVDVDGDRLPEEEDDLFTNTQVLCNSPGSLALVEPLDFASELCPTGGLGLAIGLDTNDDGAFGSGEEPAYYEVCNGADSLLVAEPIGQHSELCEAGGYFVEVGTDLNHDGQLSSEDDEESVGMAVCNGLNARMITEPLSHDDELCPQGGVAFAFYTDLDDDLLPDLETEPYTLGHVCNGLDSVVNTASLGPNAELCPNGGFRVSAGLDQDDDGFLNDEFEDFSTELVCNGLSSIVKSVTLDPNPEVCPTGGARIDVGLDDDGDRILDEGEIDSSEVICSGDHSVTKTTAVPPGPGGACPTGGVLVEIGTDHDGDGVLDQGEVTITRQVCDAQASVSRRSELAPGSSSCPGGGAKLEAGLDVNGNAALDDDEVQVTQYVCNDNHLALRHTRVEPGDGHCPGGGTLVEQGVDLNGDGELNDAEVQTSEPLCDVFDSIFSSENLPEGDTSCVHGGMRVRTGRDDGEPSGNAGDGVLQVGEAEITRDICLAGSDVLVNADSADCAVSPGSASGDSTRWATLCTLLALGIVAARRRGSRIVSKDRSGGMQHEVGERSARGAQWSRSGRVKALAGLLGMLSCCVAGNAHADPATMSIDFFDCPNNVALGERFACAGLSGGVTDGDGEPVIRTNASYGFLCPSSEGTQCNGNMTLFFDPPVSRVSFESLFSGMPGVTAYNSEGAVDSAVGPVFGVVELEGEDIIRIEFLDGINWGIRLMSLDPVTSLNGCTDQCLGEELEPLDTDGDTIPDSSDPDIDNDGVPNEDEPSSETITNPDVCGDSDLDGCDDCSIGTDGFDILSDATPLNDGPDGDGNGMCDAANRIDVLFAGCGDNEFELDDKLACDGIAGGTSSGPGGQPYVQAFDASILPNSDATGSMVLTFVVPVSRFAFTSTGAGAGTVVAWNATHTVPIDTVLNASAGDVVLTGGNILSVEFSGGVGLWGIRDISLDPEVPTVPGCAPTCDGAPLVDTDSDGTFDHEDSDDDNDGALDGQDPAPLDPHTCGVDTDHDTCDDCTTGTDQFGVLPDAAPLTDGPDGDHDGICDAGDNRPLVITEELEGDGPCEEYGVAIFTGVDRDGDGELDVEAEDEVQNVVYLCDGLDGTSTVASWEPIEGGDELCPQGGVHLLLAFDDDFNSEFDPELDQVYATRSLCNGTSSLIVAQPIVDEDELCPTDGVWLDIGTDSDNDGEFGELDDEPAGFVVCNGLDSLLVSEPTAPNAEICPTGGQIVTLGTDLNDDGEISGGEELEMSTELKICNGLDGLILTSPLEPNEEICSMGGVYVQFGTDTNGDGELSDGDASYSEQVLCNGHDSLVETSVLEPDPFTCPSGGFEVSFGTDFNGNGELDIVEQLPTASIEPQIEISSTRRVCHGLNSLVKTTPLAPDPLVCPTGGTKIEAGTDYNGNGQLDVVEELTAPSPPRVEITSSEVICHGLNTLTKQTALAPEASVCPTGGTTIELGTDDDGDGVLDTNEVDTTRNVCNALTSLSRTSVLETDSAECSYGGTKLETGVDVDGNGVLDDDEVLATEIVCSGNGIAVRSERIDVGDETCPGGGMLVENGLDTNGNKKLDDSEVQGQQTLCDAVNALFDTETLLEDAAVCPHGGVRIRIGRDDGQPTGIAANAVLELGEVEATRDVCLAATDVLVNGGTSECSVSPGSSSAGSTRVATLGTLLVLGTTLRRRRARRGARQAGARS